MSATPRILYCHCAYAQVVPHDVKQAVLDKLTASGVAFEAVPDLCAMAARKDPALQRLAESGNIQIIACHARAVKGLFAAAGAPLPPAAQILDMRAQSAGEIIAALPANGGTGADPAAVSAQVNAPRGPWAAWFPVIDWDRCTNCMQCLSFCLFGVYSASAAGQIQVEHPENCKTNCPACSRVCPEVAIMFPKYGAGPINGDVVSDADAQREKVKVDISALLGGDIYQTLRDRNERARSRFAKERDADRALAERQKCLAKLQQQLDIPPEVLRSLPSPDEILRKSQAAQAAAQAALQSAHVPTR